MTDIPTTEPTELRTGDTWKWNRTDLTTDYPSDVWTLKYYLKNAASHIEIIASAVADKTFSVTITAATTAGYTYGTYSWVAYVEKGTGASLERYEIDKGAIEILKSFADTAIYDNRTDAKKVLDDLMAAYKTYVTSNGHVQSYSIAGRQMTYSSKEEILKQISYWKQQVSNEAAAERIANGLATGRKILTRFK